MGLIWFGAPYSLYGVKCIGPVSLPGQFQAFTHDASKSKPKWLASNIWILTPILFMVAFQVSTGWRARTYTWYPSRHALGYRARTYTWCPSRHALGYRTRTYTWYPRTMPLVTAHVHTHGTLVGMPLVTAHTHTHGTLVTARYLGCCAPCAEGPQLKQIMKAA